MNVRQKILDTIDEVEDTPVIVEGLKDRRALRSLGVKHIITLKKPLFQVIEELDVKEVLILTDFDKEGKRLYRKLCRECTRWGIKIDNQLRNFLLKETPLVHIEGLPKYLRTLEEREAKKSVVSGRRESKT